MGNKQLITKEPLANPVESVFHSTHTIKLVQRRDILQPRLVEKELYEITIRNKTNSEILFSQKEYRFSKNTAFSYIKLKQHLPVDKYLSISVKLQSNSQIQVEEFYKEFMVHDFHSQIVGVLSKNENEIKKEKEIIVQSLKKFQISKDVNQLACNKLNIAIIGVQGGGKSCLVSSLCSVLADSYQSNTISYRSALDVTKQFIPLNLNQSKAINLVDSPGIHRKEALRGDEFIQRIQLIQNTIRLGLKLVKQNENLLPHLNDQIHQALIVLDAHQFQALEKSSIQAFKNIIEDLQQKKIKPFFALTCTDIAVINHLKLEGIQSEHEFSTMKYTSAFLDFGEILEMVARNVAKVFGVNQNQIYPIINYTDPFKESTRDHAAEYVLMELLSNAVENDQESDQYLLSLPKARESDLVAYLNPIIFETLKKDKYHGGSFKYQNSDGKSYACEEAIWRQKKVVDILDSKRAFYIELTTQ